MYSIICLLPIFHGASDKGSEEGNDMFLRWPAISCGAAMPHLQIRRRRRQKLAAFGMMCLNTHSAPVPPSPAPAGPSVGRLLHLRGTSVGGGRADDGTDGSWLTHEYVTSEVHQMRFERRRRRRFSSRRRRRLPYAQQKEGGRQRGSARTLSARMTRFSIIPFVLGAFGATRTHSL